MTPSNDVAAQLRDLERQGGSMAQTAHIFAALLLIAFSLGSLLSISAVPFFRFLAQWNAGTFDLPDAISVVVNVLLVLSADIALLYAASVLRALVTGQGASPEQRLHGFAMLAASVLESSTFLYMVWTFDRPTNAFLWAIGIGRALAAPLTAAYLSLARPLPVGPDDVAYQAALAAGRGVVRDVTQLAGDPTAPLSRKVSIYRSAAIMSGTQATRFAGIIDAVSEAKAEPVPPRTPEPPNGRITEHHGERNGNTQPERFTQAPRLALIPGSAPVNRASRGRMPREDARRTKAYALLDAKPNMTLDELWEHMRPMRKDDVAKLRRAWKSAQRKAVAL